MVCLANRILFDAGIMAGMCRELILPEPRCLRAFIPCLQRLGGILLMSDKIEFASMVRKNKLIDTAEALNSVDKSFFI